MRPSTASCKLPHDHSPWCSQWTSPALIFAAKATQPGMHSPGQFLQSTNDNFLIEVVEEPKRRGVLLDLVLTNRKEKVKKKLAK